MYHSGFRSFLFFFRSTMEPVRKQTGAQTSSGGRPRSPRIHQAILKAAVDLVLESGFRAISMDDIAARANVGRMTIYRRWCNKAAIIMDAFVARVDPGTLFLPARSYTESIRLQMRSMAKVFRGKDGALIRALLAEAQFDPRLAVELRDRWTMPRRKMAILIFSKESRMDFCALTRTLTQSSTSFTPPSITASRWARGPCRMLMSTRFSTMQ
jgi:AcrR family transcriptional regulator